MNYLIDPAGALRQISVSQVEKADTKQTGGCLRKWWFEASQGLKPEQNYAKNEGTAGHELLRRYLTTGERPQGRTLMGKAVTGAILKGELPTPGEDLIVEKRFSGQDMRDESRCECGHALESHGKQGCASNGCGQTKTETRPPCSVFRPAWIPLDVSQTLHLAGVPWDGAIDLVHRRGPRPVVLDHKFSSDPELYAKQPSELIKTVQMPIYAYSQIPYYPDATEFELVHHYVSKKGVLSFMRSAVVSVPEILERVADVVQVVERMRAVTLATNQDDVPAHASEARCGAWNGCAHQSICSAYRRFQSNTHNPGVRTMALTAAEQALFDSIPMSDAAPAAVTQAAAAPEPEGEDAEEAALAAQLAAAAKALEEKKAKRKMQFIDVPAPDAPPAPAPVAPPVAPPAAIESVTCAPCGAAITSENGSKLRDGTWKHIGCPAAVLPPDAPASKPEIASEPPALPPAPKQRVKKAAPAEVPALPKQDPCGCALCTYNRTGSGVLVGNPVCPRAASTGTKVPGESASERAATAALPSHADPKPDPGVRLDPVHPEGDLLAAARAFLLSRFKSGGVSGIVGENPVEINQLIHAALAIVTN